MSEQGDVIMYIKHRNRRIIIRYEAESDVYMLLTKKLVSRKNRKISQTSSIFSPESFWLLNHALEMAGQLDGLQKSQNRALGRIEKDGRPELHIYDPAHDEEADNE